MGRRWPQIPDLQLGGRVPSQPSASAFGADEIETGNMVRQGGLRAGPAAGSSSGHRVRQARHFVTGGPHCRPTEPVPRPTLPAGNWGGDGRGRRDPESFHHGRTADGEGEKEQSTAGVPWGGEDTPAGAPRGSPAIRLGTSKNGKRPRSGRGRAKVSPASAALTWFQCAKVGASPPALPSRDLGAGQLGARPRAA